MSDLHTSLARLHGLYPKLIDLKLDRLIRLLAALGNPQNHLPPAIHVAGTNGKGSVCAFIRAMAEAAGRRVHVYTSPHLVRFNERIRIAGSLVTDQALAAVLDEIEAANKGDEITVFEAITAAAFLLFARSPADLCVIEVGLGGRFDATNVISPIACAITAISLDHQEFLGTTLEAIATEKAGIIKPGIPVVTGCQPRGALAAITRAAAAAHAPLHIRDRDWQITQTSTGISFDGLTLPAPALPGAHQMENAGIAMMTLRAAGLALPSDAFAVGLRTVEWPARLQRLRGKLNQYLPKGAELWLDGAHNQGGATALATQLTTWNSPTTLILGMKQSKDIEEFIRILRPRAAHIYAVAEPGQHLALPIPEIIKAAQGNATPGPTIRDALSQITQPTRILICGSLYLAGEALKLDAGVVG